ncbi:MAG: SDR family oxidoreductase [Lachnospiraceae bacterium]|nr:SDR family oxidoreductase [Lachnospiraceae bacterium]
MEKSALITGSTKGIGKAIALKLLSKDYFVFLNYAHDDASAEALKKELDEKGFVGKYQIVKADVSTEEGTGVLKESVLGKGLPLYYLVLNAASNGTERNSFKNITRAEMAKMFEINLFSPFFLVQSFADSLAEGGAVLFISSAMGIYPHSTYIPYGTTKAAEIFLAKSLVKEFAEQKVRVNAIAPHCIETEMFPGNRGEEQLSRMKASLAVGEFGKAEDVADLALTVLENQHMNGAVIKIDGGYDYK